MQREGREYFQCPRACGPNQEFLNVRMSLNLGLATDFTPSPGALFLAQDWEYQHPQSLSHVLPVCPGTMDRVLPHGTYNPWGRWTKGESPNT